jgi:tRNA 2-thiouridine synthesizing protein B
MAVLHVVSRSPFESRCLEHCLARAGAGDAVLLAENGVYAAPAWRPAAGIACYALSPDMSTRGIDPKIIAPHVILIDYAGFVDLAAEYPLIQSWY